MPPTLYGEFTIKASQELDGLGPTDGESITVTWPFSSFLLSCSSMAAQWLPVVLGLLCLMLKENRTRRVVGLLVCVGVLAGLLFVFREVTSPLDWPPLFNRIGWSLAVGYTFILFLIFRLNGLGPGRRIAAVAAVFALSGAIGWLALFREYEYEGEQFWYAAIYTFGVASLVLAVLTGRWLVRKQPTPKRFRRCFLLMLVFVPMVLALPVPYMIPAFYEDGLAALGVAFAVGLVTAGALLALMIPFLVLLVFSRVYRERLLAVLGLREVGAATAPVYNGDISETEEENVV